MPMRSLSELLATHRLGPEPAVFVVEFSGLRTAIACEEIRGHFEVILRPTSPRLAHACGVSSSALTDSGELVLVLAPHRLKATLGAPAGVPTQIRAADAALTLRHRVLVVDDSVIVRDLLTEILTSAGYQVRGAKNGKEALNELSDFDPHVVLSDIEMPEMDGFLLLESIRTRSAKLPVVLVTARKSDEDRRRAEALGANAYLEKGRFQSRSVLDTVKLLLGGGS
jgi:CheY-like chemotaxis protein